MKKFSEFLLELWDEPAHEQGGGNQIKADIVDIVRSHIHKTNKEVLFADLRQGKEKEFFEYYFNKLNQKFSLNGIKTAKQFRNTLNIVFSSPELSKTGRYVQVFARLPDEESATQIYNKLTQQYHYKDPNQIDKDY
jgi:hypothetical protein